MDELRSELSSEEKELLSYVDQAQEEMEERLRAWCAINSGSYHLEGLRKMADVLEEAFSELGGEVRRLPADPARRIGSDGKEAALELGDSLIMCRREQISARALVGGHMDTVFGPEHPFQNGTDLPDGRYNAPGAADMKGGLMVLLYALKAIERSPYAANFGYDLLIVADEEIGSPGTRRLTSECAKNKRFACVYEPSFPDGGLARARKGSGNFVIRIEGKAAHAGRAIASGRNAVVAAGAMAVALHAMTDAKTGVSVNVGRIDGGSPVNIVPEHALVRFNLRLLDDADQKPSMQRIAAIIDEATRTHDVKAHLFSDSWRPAKMCTPALETFCSDIKGLAGLLHDPLDFADTGGVCDGNFIAAQGVPVVDNLGVIGGALHSAQEYIEVASLSRRARLSALLFARAAQGKLSLPGLPRASAANEARTR